MRKFKMGRKRPVAHGPRLSLSNYMMKSFPTAPMSGDYTKPAQHALSKMYLNDKLGDCVIAWMAHAEGIFTASGTSAPTLFTDAGIIAMYSAIGGYVLGDASTDQGCDEVTALNYWKQHGFVRPSHKITAYLAVNAADKNEINSALWLFENIMYGVELPDAWVNPEPNVSGFVWDVAGAPDPNNGHCFGGAKWSPAGVTIETWGMNGLLTYAATAKYAADAVGGQLFTVLSPETINRATQKAPNGFDWTQLTADMNAIGAI